MRMALAMVGVFLTSCGSPAPSSPATPPQTGTAIATRPTAASSAPSAMAQLATAESRYGRILVDGSGRTAYLFDIERDPRPGATTLARSAGLQCLRPRHPLLL